MTADEGEVDEGSGHGQKLTSQEVRVSAISNTGLPGIRRMKPCLLPDFKALPSLPWPCTHSTPDSTFILHSSYLQIFVQAVLSAWDVLPTSSAF